MTNLNKKFQAKKNNFKKLNFQFNRLDINKLI